MDANNVADLKALAPQEEQRRIHLFMEVVAGKETMDVPDPYYTGDFEETYRLVGSRYLRMVEKKSTAERLGL